jgi:hypothetical protein
LVAHPCQVRCIRGAFDGEFVAFGHEDNHDDEEQMIESNGGVREEVTIGERKRGED